MDQSPAQFDLHLSLPAGRGRRVALEAGLREAIRSGRVGSGQRLPSSRVLARDLGLARGTVVEAYEQLVAEGYLRARPGAGTEVAEIPGRHQPPRHRASPPPPAADFRIGRPDLSGFPRAAWVRALRRALNKTPDGMLGPGGPRGATRLHEALAAYLRRARGALAEPELIVVCSGFVQGLRLVCEGLRTQGAQRVALEDPCLPEHRAVVSASGLDLLPLPVDEGGARPDALDHQRVDAVVLTPAHQAPLGPTLTPDRRAQFVRWAQQHDAFLVEDDYDGEFRYDRQPIGALQGLDPERVVYAGTASKSLAPALRLGWLAVPARLISPVADAKRRADRGTGVIEQLTLAEMIETGEFDRHIRRMRTRYKRRRNELIAGFSTTLPSIRLSGTAAGLHVVALLPTADSEREVIAAAAKHSVALTGLDPFWHGPRSDTHGLVLGYGSPPEHGWEAALTLLLTVLEEAVAGGSSQPDLYN